MLNRKYLNFGSSGIGLGTAPCTLIARSSRKKITNESATIKNKQTARKRSRVFRVIGLIFELIYEDLSVSSRDFSMK